MKFFWPSRSKAKGFAIKDFANKYPEKISSVSSQENSNQFQDDRLLKFKNEDSNNKALSHLLIKKIHWANRDFSEYREAS